MWSGMEGPKAGVCEAQASSTMEFYYGDFKCINIEIYYMKTYFWNMSKLVNRYLKIIKTHAEGRPSPVNRVQYETILMLIIVRVCSAAGLVFLCLFPQIYK